MMQIQRGDIFFVRIPSDPPGKHARPVIVVSTDSRNRHECATTVTVVPLSTTRRDLQVPTHVLLQPGETGLKEPSEAQAENIVTVLKADLQQSREPTRRQSSAVLKKIAKAVVIGLGFDPQEL